MKTKPLNDIIPGAMVALNKLDDATWYDVISVDGFVMVIREHSDNPELTYANQSLDTSFVAQIRYPLEPRSKAFRLDWFQNVGERKPLKAGDMISGGRPFVGVTFNGLIATQGPRPDAPIYHQPANVGCEVHKFAGTIDITPTWRAIVPILVAGIENGGKARDEALISLYELADFADATNARIKNG